MSDLISAHSRETPHDPIPAGRRTIPTVGRNRTLIYLTFYLPVPLRQSQHSDIDCHRRGAGTAGIEAWNGPDSLRVLWQMNTRNARNYLDTSATDPATPQHQRTCQHHIRHVTAYVSFSVTEIETFHVRPALSLARPGFYLPGPLPPMACDRVRHTTQLPATHITPPRDHPSWTGRQACQDMTITGTNAPQSIPSPLPRPNRRQPFLPSHYPPHPTRERLFHAHFTGLQPALHPSGYLTLSQRRVSVRPPFVHRSPQRQPHINNAT